MTRLVSILGSPCIKAEDSEQQGPGTEEETGEPVRLLRPLERLQERSERRRAAVSVPESQGRGPWRQVWGLRLGRAAAAAQCAPGSSLMASLGLQERRACGRKRWGKGKGAWHS